MLAQLRGLLCNVDLQSLVPKCGGCFENFDAFLRAPYILSCCHTLCLTCLTPQVPQRQQKRKRKCPICRAKYEKYTMNSALLTLIIEIREITICYQRSCIHCEQCGKQAIVIDTRRCRTCENVVHEMLGHPLQLRKTGLVMATLTALDLGLVELVPLQTCCICLQCCVEHHNGHILQEVFTTMNRSENATMYKSLSLRTKYARHEFKTKSVHSAAQSAPNTSDSASSLPIPAQIGCTGNESYATYVNISTISRSDIRIVPEDVGVQFHNASIIKKK